MKIPRFIKVIARKDDNKIIFRKNINTVKLGDKEFNVSCNYNGMGLMLEDKKGNIIGLDTGGFTEYILNNYDEILDASK